MSELLVGLTKYFMFYNGGRPYQALEIRTPHEVHQNAVGGDATILDKYGAVEVPPIALRFTGTAQDEFG